MVWNTIDFGKHGQLIHGDCIHHLHDLPMADLIIADPPFNIGFKYDGYKDSVAKDDYLLFTEKWIMACSMRLRAGGSIYIMIGDDYAAEVCCIAKKYFNMRNWIIWHYTFGQQTSQKFARSHTHILYLTSKYGTDSITFNPDAVRVPSARQTIYADKRANSKGKLPDDTWFLRPQDAMDKGFFDAKSDTWMLNRVCGTFKERGGWHGCQMPLAVIDRIVLASSNPGDLIIDPFGGSSTSAISAILNGRRFINIEQSEEYVKRASIRIAEAIKTVEASDATQKENS